LHWSANREDSIVVSDGATDRDQLRQAPSSAPTRRTKDGAISATGGVPVAPGDLVRFPDGRRRRVTTTFACHDPSGGARWWWSFLDDGTLLDQSLTGDWLHVRHEVLPAGSPFARELVGPNGHLEDFEAQVRGGAGRPTVAVVLDGRKWHVATTGIVIATRIGLDAPLPGWKSLGTPAPGERDVWFSLEDRERPMHATIGIWTDHVALATGRVLRPRRTRAKTPPCIANQA
jgi:hypothetical protein